jgi:glycosyltransferase involved in cell wall biosynthesis
MSLSIVTPSFNQGRFIERTIASVLGQSLPPLEYFVQDGGSTDETVGILRRHEGALQFESRKDRGQAHAVNLAIGKTTGEIVGWINSDDVYRPGAFAAVTSYFDAHPEVDVVYGAADHIDADDRIIEPYPTEPWSPERLRETCFICQPAVFFRRRAFAKFGLLDESLNYCMDYEYWLRLAKAGADVRFLDVCLAGSRLYADTKTLGARVKVHREIAQMMKRLLGTVPDAWLSNYAHAVVEAKMSREAHPRRFVFEVSARTVLAALRWNGTVSPAQRSTVLAWLRGM